MGVRFAPPSLFLLMIALGPFALIGLTAMAHRSQFDSPHGIQTDALAKKNTGWIFANPAKNIDSGEGHGSFSV
jgi:hypothetical protein